jgi:hypothetical protein
MCIRPYLGTVIGVIVGIGAVLVWMLTFEPNGGVELSHFLFPISALALERAYYPDSSIPVPLWYGGAVVQWVCIGILVDLVRRKLRAKKQNAPA